MKKVVLFKCESEEYSRAFSQLNYQPVFVEPLQFAARNLDQLRASLASGEYAGLVVTSPRAIDALAQCWAPETRVRWSRRRCYTVGDVSGQRIQQLLGLDALGTASGNAENLANLIANENPSTSKFLFPCGNLRTETLIDVLKAKGITIDPLTVYETSENVNLKNDLLSLSNAELSPCCMVFFSPSGCEYIHRQLQTFNNKLLFLPHFAIGNSTAHKIENLGLEIAGVAAHPKPDSMVESVQQYFTALQSC